MNFSRLFFFLLGFLCYGSISALARTPASSVADSLLKIYVSVKPAGNNFIVDQGKWVALFNKEGMPLTDFKFLRMRPGLDGEVLAYDSQNCSLLDAKGNFLFKFEKKINEVDTTHRLYRYYETYTNRNRKVSGTVYNETGKVVLQYFDSKTYYLGRCRISDGYVVGIKDTFGQTILPQIYSSVSISEWGAGALKNDTAYIFDKNGKLKFSTPAQGIQMLSQGILATKMYGRWCLKDSSGKNLTPFAYGIIKEIAGGNYIATYGDILDYKGNVVANPGAHKHINYHHGWYTVSYSGRWGESIWDEHFKPLFDGAVYEVVDFYGTRFVALKKSDDDKQVKFYDRKKRKFSRRNIEEALPGDAYLLTATDSVHRFVLKGNKKLEFPYFSNIEPIERTPFLLIDNQSEKKRHYLQQNEMIPIYSLPGLYPQRAVGLLDTNLKVILPLKYSRIQVMNNHLIAAWNDNQNLFCLVNEKGKKLIELNDGYTKINQRRGLVDLYTKEEYLLIDSTGNILVRGNYPPSLLHPDLTGNTSRQMPRLMLCLDSSNYYGLYRLKGRQILPNEYYPVSQQMTGTYALKKNDSIYFVNNNGMLLYRGKGFSGTEYHLLKSYAMLFKNEKGKWGVWDATGNEIVPFIYDTTGKSMTGGYFIGKKQQYALLDDNGQLRFPLQNWLPTRRLVANYYQDSAGHLFAVRDRQLTPQATIPERLKNRYIDFRYRKIVSITPGNILGLVPGLYNRNLQRIAPYHSEYNNQIAHGKATISDATGKNIAVIDTNGNILIPFFPMPNILRMSDNQVFAAYKTGKALCFQRKNGKFVSVPVRLDSTGFDPVRREFNFGNTLIFLRLKGSIGLATRQGNILLDTMISAIVEKNNLLLVKKAGKWGIMNYQLKYIQRPTADSIATTDGNFFIFSNGMKGLYHTDYRIYIPPLYENIYLPASLRNNFLVVKQHKQFIIVNHHGKVLLSGLDTIRPAVNIAGLVAYRGNQAFRISLNDSGRVYLQATENIPHLNYDGSSGAIVITRNNQHFGLYNNTTFQRILPEKYDAIDRLKDYFIAWKYKPDKHQGMDSTILVDKNGKILMHFKGWRPLVLDHGYLYINGADTTPVWKGAQLIITGGYDIKAFFERKFFIVAVGERQGTIGPDGTWLIPLFRGTITDIYLRDYGFWLGTIMPRKKSKNKKYFLITREGKKLDKKLYDRLIFKEDGSILYTKGNKTGYLKTADAEEP